MKNEQLFRCLTIGLLAALLLTSFGTQNTRADGSAVTRYLAFQIFTSGLPPNPTPGATTAPTLSPPPSKSMLEQTVSDMVDQISMTGDSQDKLAFIVGPLAFDQTDAQIQQMIQDSFAVALEFNVAVGFHIDDSMFWARRSDLWSNPRNVEWLNWQGTPNTGRRIDWSAQPSKLSPQMCFNSPAIEAEVNRLSTLVIGRAIEQGIQTLTAQGKPELFAGVIVGWETQIGQDFDTGDDLGYCALSNLGFSQSNPPADLDSAREQVVQSFIELWASGIARAGIDPAKIYSHTAVLAQAQYDQSHTQGVSYAQANHFAPPDVAFGTNYHPGYSTYPQPGLVEQLYGEFQAHGNPAWASAEGSTVDPATQQSVVDSETYLAWMFNHGAALVNLYGWGVGTKGTNPFWQAADNPQAIAAYRKFLNGQPLIANVNDPALSSASLPAEIQQIQANLPSWVSGNPARQAAVMPLMARLDHDVKSGNLTDAQNVASSILSLIGQ